MRNAAAAAAKSLQSCPTLCDPLDGRLTSSSVPGILQARILEWVAISFSNAGKWKVKVKSFSRVQFLATPWTAAYQAPPSMGFSRQEYWSGMPLPSPFMRNSVQFSRSVVSDSFRPHESQHARPPCPSPTPGVHWDSRPSSQWGHPAISSSVVPFSSCSQSLPAPESFPMSQFFAWGGQSIGVSALALFLPRSPRADLFQNGLVGSPCSPRDSQESSPTPQLESIHFLTLSLLYGPTLTSVHDYWKNHSFVWTFVGKVMSLLFNTLPKFIIAFLPRSKGLWISWLQSPSAMIMETKKIVGHCFHCFPIYLPWNDETKCHNLSFLNVEF